MARSLPTGTVAFLFTDIEGSTRLARSRPEQFPALLERHRALLREAFSTGAEVDTAGDAFFVAFDRVGDAVSAAAAGQRLLASEPWPEGGEIRVRMGLHAGTADVIGDNYVGAEVHRAARICAAAHGRQVLISHAAAGLIDERVTDLVLRMVGEYRLKDFDAPQTLYQLEGDGLATEFPPPRTAEGASGIAATGADELRRTRAGAGRAA